MLKKLGNITIINAANKQMAVIPKKTGNINTINKQNSLIYITNPFSGKQTQIHIKMFDEFNENYFPKFDK